MGRRGGGERKNEGRYFWTNWLCSVCWDPRPQAIGEQEQLPSLPGALLFLSSPGRHLGVLLLLLEWLLPYCSECFGCFASVCKRNTFPGIATGPLLHCTQRNNLPWLSHTWALPSPPQGFYQCLLFRFIYLFYMYNLSFNIIGYYLLRMCMLLIFINLQILLPNDFPSSWSNSSFPSFF